MSPFLKTFRTAKSRSTPLLCVRMTDPTQTVRRILDSYNGGAPPTLEWDVVRGCQWLNASGFQVAWQVLLERGPAPTSPTEVDLRDARDELALKTGSLVDVLAKGGRFPEKSTLFVHNAHLWWKREDVTQAIWNLRDEWKLGQRTLALLTLLGGSDLPLELRSDVVTLIDPLPSAEELQEIALSAFADSGAAPPDDATLERVVDAVVGLAASPAETAMAMSFIRDADNNIAMDMEALWERKRRAIEETPGLSVWRGGTTLKDVAGLSNATNFLVRLLTGQEPPRLIVILDEFEKAVAGGGNAEGGGGDSSGNTQEMIGTLLTFMEEMRVLGMIFAGHAGGGKTFLAKCIGEHVGIPTISLDFSGAKSKWVGESTANLRMMLEQIRAISRGRCLFIATANGVTAFSAPLKRRFCYGTWMFDLPTTEEQASMWKLYLGKYNLAPDAALPDCQGWTAAEIRNCCEIAWRLRVPLTEAAEFISPVAQLDPAGVENLRVQADRLRFNSASYSGKYRYQRSPANLASALPGAGRTIQVPES